MFLRPTAVAAFVAGLVFSNALAEPSTGYSRAAYATPVCPAGADATNCLDNAYRAIDDLERRVMALETGRRASSFASAQGPVTFGDQPGAASVSETRSGNTMFHHPDCLPGWAWNGSACVSREGD